MATERQVVDAYTRRALQLIRVGNSLATEADAELRALARELRVLLSEPDLSTLGRRDIAALVRATEEAIRARYERLSATQQARLAALLGVDAAWATRAADLTRAASTAALDAAAAGLLVMGAPVQRHWQRQATNLADAVAAAVRTAVSVGHDTPTLLANVIGEGRRGRERGGLLGAARRQAQSLAETSAHAAAYAGRREAWKAGGVNALKWHAILDSRTTIGCATRAGRLYTLDFEPIGHDIPMERPPPAHWNCRSILVGMRYPGELPPDGKDPYSESLDEWLARHPPELQDELLGPGRADLWRRGVITTRDLVGQRGQTLTVEELGRRP